MARASNDRKRKECDQARRSKRRARSTKRFRKKSQDFTRPAEPQQFDLAKSEPNHEFPTTRRRSTPHVSS